MAKKNPINWPDERKAAIALGNLRYRTGIACPVGHICDRKTKTGQCVECERDRDRKYRSDHPGRMALKGKKAYAKHSEKIKQKRREWYAKPENKEKAKETLRLYMLKKRDEILRKARESAASYRARFPEKAKQAIDNWWDKNPGRKKTYHHARRARKNGNGGTHTVADINSIFRSQRGRCAYCREKLAADGNERHIDHIVPLINGGKNDRKNLQLLCRPCNLEKGRRDPIDHARTLGMLL